MSAAGKLTGERLLQLEERAVPVGAAIAKTMGVSQESVRKLVSEGKVDFETFSKAMDSISAKGGLAFGGMIKLSKTWTGLLSTLSDNIKIVAQGIGQRFLPHAKAAASEVIKLLGMITKSDRIKDFAAAFAVLGTVLGGIGIAVVAMSVPFAALAIKIGLLVGGLASAVAAIYSI